MPDTAPDMPEAAGAHFAPEDTIRAAWCTQCAAPCAHERDVLNRHGQKIAAFIACPCHEPE